MKARTEFSIKENMKKMIPELLSKKNITCEDIAWIHIILNNVLALDKKTILELKRLENNCK